ncbi:uncharacterized protein [Epargyreus clarus]|uniref:uncharacterized protein n=1 Tax=Epargyreus clarus TaxID=520877 RepID=UPI003C300F15
MVPNHYSLTWDSYKSSICGGFSSLQQNGEFVDMTLAADGHLVKVHQVLIALASPYLKELINSVPSPHPVIFLNNVPHAILGLLLEYIYTGEVLVPAKHLQSFMEAAKALHIRGLEAISSNYYTGIKKTPPAVESTTFMQVIKKGIPLDIHSVQTSFTYSAFLRYYTLNNICITYIFSRIPRRSSEVRERWIRIINQPEWTPIKSSFDLPTAARKISVRQEPQITNIITVKDEAQAQRSAKEEYQSYADTVMEDMVSEDDSRPVDNLQTSSNQRTNEMNSLEKVKNDDDEDNRMLEIMQDPMKMENQEKLSSSNLQFTVSIRGSLQVILNRYMYNLQSTSHNSGVRRWRCIEYRNKKCPATLVTKGNVVLNRACLHSHSFHDKKILAKIEKNSVYSALDEVEGYKEKERRKSVEEEWPIETPGFISLDCSSDINDTSNSKSTNETVSVQDMYKISTFLYIVFSVCVVYSKPMTKTCKTKCCSDDPAVRKFQEYVRIDTSCQENLKYSVEFWQRQASELGLPFAVYYPGGLPICVITWTGTDPSLPSIMLNSHADVVGVEEKYWTYPPFSAHIDEKCNLYGRGTQDTKCVTIQYMEAIRSLMNSNITLLRTLHIVIMPDEETGGFNGIKPFMKTEEFRSLNIGFALDEGLNSVEDIIYASYQDRRPWQMKFTVFGESGHGSGMPSGSAMEKMNKLFNIVMKYREEQKEMLKRLDPSDFGGSTSVNINIIEGGIGTNVIPTEMSAVIDMRLAVSANVADVGNMVESWRMEAGNDTKIDFIRHDLISLATPLDSNPYWQAMVQTAKDIGINMQPVVLPATSDMLVMRNAGIPAVGFAPKVRTPNHLHGNDEYLSVEVFLEGIDIYVAILKSLGNVRGSDPMRNQEKCN